jgi:hypothetical protein
MRAITYHGPIRGRSRFHHEPRLAARLATVHPTPGVAGGFVVGEIVLGLVSSSLLCVAALLAGAGCGGKLAPLEADAGGAADAAADGDASGPFVTSVTPSSGPNCGGTQVVIGGYGFVPGSSDVTFAGFPATGSCSSTTECTALSAFAGYQDFDQPVHVQVAVRSEDGGANVSPTTPLDVFTYTAGPRCSFILSCAGTLYFPDLVITCPTSVTFYSQYLHGLTARTKGTTYRTGTEDFPIVVVACFGDSATTSCTTFVATSSPLACGNSDLCVTCIQAGGKCDVGPPPTCTK